MEHRKYVGFEIRRLSNLIMRKLDKQVIRGTGNGMTITHVWVIGYLVANKDKDIFQKNIEEKFSIRRSTATNILKLMEKNGLITRVPMEHDARLKKIMITEKTQEMHDRMHEESVKIEQILLTGITEEEREQFQTTLGKMKVNLETLALSDEEL